MITKTDFLAFLTAPKHLWALKHDRIEIPPSPYEIHTMQQGQLVEALARDFMREHVLTGQDDFSFQESFRDGSFQARVDILTRSPEKGTVDIYEVKSGTSIKKEDRFDVAFQRLVCEASETVENVYLVHLNKDYLREGEVVLKNLFVVENLNEETDQLREQVLESRQQALAAASTDDPENILSCHKLNECPCPSLCHGELPEYPIFDIPRLHKNKAINLKNSGILSIHDLPEPFPLTDTQRPHVEAIRSGTPLIREKQISAELQQLIYPLSFLDYETFNPAVPIYDGYRPYEHIVFQYSLHVREEPESELEHVEFLHLENVDPGPLFLEHLKRKIPGEGSILVWNQYFEKSKNREMARRYPGYSRFLEDLNDRIYDLMKVFSKGLYIHPDFHGSASIKKVLPVLCPELDEAYSGLKISSGEEALLAWFEVISGNFQEEIAEEIRRDLLAYCELDTLAMVRILDVVRKQADR